MNSETLTTRFWGPYAWSGLKMVAATFILDQVTKLIILRVVDLDVRPPIQVLPFLELAMAWNKGVSYGLLTTHVQQVLIVMSLFISAVLWLWLCRAGSRLAALALGLVIGGALGNCIDRAAYGAVADFVHIHWGEWSWYIFNVADIAIVAGVVLMLYDSMVGRQKA